jgi:hypothetical protein
MGRLENGGRDLWPTVRVDLQQQEVDKKHSKERFTIEKGFYKI